MVLRTKQRPQEEHFLTLPLLVHFWEWVEDESSLPERWARSRLQGSWVLEELHLVLPMELGSFK